MVKLVAERSVKYRQKGDDGRWYEYAGEYGVDLPATIKNTKTHGWYVKRGNNFFMLTADDDVSVNTSTIPTAATDATNWERMEGSRNYYIANAYFGAYAHFGSLIINGNWMISQHGTVNGNASQSYTSFDPSHPSDNTGSNFIPNFCVNMMTGKSYQNDAEIRGIIRASLVYSPVKVVEDDYTINPAVEPYHTFYIDAYWQDVDIYLPDASVYDGLELQFFKYSRKPPTGNGIHVTPIPEYDIYLKCMTNSIYFVDTNDDFKRMVYSHGGDTGDGSGSIDTATYIIRKNVLVNLKAMCGEWYVVSGDYE